VSKKAWLYLISFLTVIAILSWLVVISLPKPNLRVIACDVGQGDAILITKADLQILVDGGPGNKVISCLSRYMPFWDRTIEAVVSTHPDADHSTGLVQVFRNYSVTHFVTTEINRETDVYSTLKKEVGESKAQIHFVEKGERLIYGGIYFDVLHPGQIPPASETERASFKTNNYSIVMKMGYGDFDALLTGDIEDKVSDLIADTSNVNNLVYLKVPHHGSKNGLSQKLLDEVRPQVAVISLGKNSFGHPHEEVLKLLSNSDTKILRTDQIGDVVVETNGSTWWIK